MSELSFKIEASAKAFEILANNLYSDKISAVIRELSCNAADAHAEAGIPSIPFQVDLPSYTKQFFRVRDFGNGLKVDQIEEIFTVFFASSKVGNKSYTGAFGLGCKTPFAITDKFFVNSYIDGIVHSYQCYKNDGIPSIIYSGNKKTIDQNGLEIIVPVNASFDEWKTKAKNIYEYFKVRPKTNFAISYFAGTAKHIISANWENTPDSGMWIVMSNVRYRLDSNKINSPFSSSMYKSHGIAIHVPPRSIEVTPSREEIAYTPNTIEFINNYLEKIKQKFTDDLVEFVNKRETKINAVIDYLCYAEKMKYEYIFHDTDHGMQNIFWHGHQLSINKSTHQISIEHDSIIEIGTYFLLSKHSSNVKSKLLTKTNYNIGSNATDACLKFIINDTKASIESIKSWCNRMLKASNYSTIAFFVVKQEYAFLIKNTNKIYSNYIINCSSNGVVKNSIKKTKLAAKNLCSFILNTNPYVMYQTDANSDTDSFTECCDKNKNIYFIAYSNRMTSPIISNCHLVDTDLDSFLRRSRYFTSLKENENIEFLPSKILVIKDNKKNKDFMRKFSKENGVKFINFYTYLINTINKIISTNEKVSFELINSFVIGVFTGFVEFENLFDETPDDIKHMFEYKSKLNINISNSIHKIQELKNINLDNFDKLYKFINDVFTNKLFQNNLLRDTIHFLKFFILKDHSELQNTFFRENMKEAKGFFELLKSTIEKYKILFCEENYREKLLINLYENNCILEISNEKQDVPLSLDKPVESC